MTKTVVRWDDMSVNVFDENTVEIRELRGPYKDRRELILKMTSNDVEFWHGVKNHTIKQVNREEW